MSVEPKTITNLPALGRVLGATDVLAVDPSNTGSPTSKITGQEIIDAVHAAQGNIYTEDGTLSGNRIVAFAGNNFEMSSTNNFSWGLTGTAFAVTTPGTYTVTATGALALNGSAAVTLTGATGVGVSATSGDVSVTASSNVNITATDNIVNQVGGTDNFVVKDSGGSVAEASAVAVLNSTTRGFLGPRMTTAERDAISTPATGLQIFNNTSNEPEYYNGTAWVSFAGSAGTNVYDSDGTLTGSRTITANAFDFTVSGTGSTNLTNSGGITLTADAGNALLRSLNTTVTSTGGDVVLQTTSSSPANILLTNNTGGAFNAISRTFSFVSGQSSADNNLIEFVCENNGSGTARINFSSGDSMSLDTPGVMIGSGRSVTPDASAQLEIDSTNKGFLGPRLTTTQRDAISSPAAGLQIYNTTTNVLNYYNGTQWSEIGSGGSSTLTQNAIGYGSSTNTLTGDESKLFFKAGTDTFGMGPSVDNISQHTMTLNLSSDTVSYQPAADQMLSVRTRNGVVFGEPEVHPSVALSVNSPNKGIRWTRNTTNALTSPQEGTTTFDIVTKQFMGYNGTEWVILG